MVSQHPLVGAVLARRYRIDAPLGSGSGTSAVFDATDVRSQKKVVVRAATAESLVDLSAGVVSASDAVEVFKRQTQLLSSISHPSLASVEDWGTETVGTTLYTYTVLETYSGGTLRQILDRGRRLTASQALVVGLDVCRALHFIHSKGWVHGDVRPANIFLGEDNRVRLAGLGIKRVMDAEQMSNEQASYAAPEIASGEQPTEQSDVYSLALTLLETITGVVPFLGDTAGITLAARVGKLLPVSADLGPIAAPLERAGRPEATERFTALEFGRALAAIAEKVPLPEPIETLAPLSFEAVIEQKVAEKTGEITRPSLVGIPEDDSAGPATGGSGRLVISETDLEKPLVVASPSEVRRHKRLWAIGAVIAVLIAGGIGFRVLVKQSHTIPAVVGISEGEARNLLSPFNWDVVVASEHSDEIAAGSVIRTEPADGTSLKEGEVLLVVVSKGATLARMPDIAGKAVQEALDELTALGLVPTVKETENEDIPAGATISWIIPEQPGLSPGDEVLKGTAIDVLVSVGPALREVPSLLGLTLEQAQAALVDLKLVLTETPPSKSNAAAEGTIGAQAPPPGTKVPRDSGIAYSISLGPDLVALPNIIGNNFSIVEPRLVESGFLVGKVTGRQQNRLKKALVGGQEVSNGDEVARGATVDLVFP